MAWDRLWRKGTSVAGPTPPDMAPGAAVAGLSRDEILALFPGLLWNIFEAPHALVIPVDQKIKRLRIEGVSENAVALACTHVRLWTTGPKGKVVPFRGDATVTLSSRQTGFDNPDCVLKGDPNNLVTLRTEKEMTPWCEVDLPTPIALDLVEIFMAGGGAAPRHAGVRVTITTEDGQTDVISDPLSDRTVRQRLSGGLTEVLDRLRADRLFQSADGTAEVARLEAAVRAHIGDRDDDRRADARLTLVKALIATCRRFESAGSPDFGTSPEAALRIPCEGRVTRSVICRFWGDAPALLGGVRLYSAAGGETPCRSLAETAVVTPSPTRAQNRRRADAGFPWRSRELRIDLETAIRLDRIELWAKTARAIPLALVREIVLIDAEGRETVVEATFPCFAAERGVLRLFAWLMPQGRGPRFAKAASSFYTRYRLNVLTSLVRSYEGDSKLLDIVVTKVREVGTQARALPPVVYTRHGLSVPLSEKDPAAMVATMADFARLMERELQLQVFPCFGTLLGFYRDKAFMAHDDDVDMATVIPISEGEDPLAARDRWMKKIKAAGINCMKATPTSLNIHCFRPGLTIDLFFMFRTGGTAQSHMENYQVRTLDAALLEPVSRLTFMGEAFYAPNDIEGFLRARYGDGWSVPDPTFEL